MKEINGFVCVATIKSNPSRGVLGQQILFGPSGSDNRFFNPANFETNGLTPFRSRRMALSGSKALERRGIFGRTWIATVEMKIAETEQEIYSLKNKHNLVVIKRDPDGLIDEILGPIVGKRPTLYPLPAARVIENGLKTFRSFEPALHVAKEVNRQAQQAIWVATFKLRILDP